MSRASWDGLFPVNPRGELLDYDKGFLPSGTVRRSKEELQFTGTVTFARTYHGRSSAGLNFRDAAGRIMSLSLFEANSFIPKLVDGTLTGTFVPVKRGANYMWTFLP